MVHYNISIMYIVFSKKSCQSRF